jgi:hypothetical protein
MRHAPVELWSLQRDEVAWAIHALNGSSFPVGISSLFSMGNSGNMQWERQMYVLIGHIKSVH